MTLLLAIALLWVLCACLTSWFWATGWPNNGARLDYIQGFVLGMLLGPFGTIVSFVLWDPRR